MGQTVLYAGFHFHVLSLVICAFLTLDAPECIFLNNLVSWIYHTSAGDYDAYLYSTIWAASWAPL